MVVEVVSSELEFGSIGGGGRYDELTKVFGGRSLPVLESRLARSDCRRHGCLGAGLMLPMESPLFSLFISTSWEWLKVGTMFTTSFYGNTRRVVSRCCQSQKAT